VDLTEIRKSLGSKIALQGKRGPRRYCLGRQKKNPFGHAGTLSVLSEDKGHILNLGHGILQNTPIENARLFIETGQHVLFQDARPAAQAR